MATLYLVATPIGNLEDITLRALKHLRKAEAIACEDTRHTCQLLSLLDIPKPPIMFSCFEHNQARAIPKILALLNENKHVILVSDAGYPGISDPGYPVVRQMLEAGHSIEVIPGACAATNALLKSGLPSSSYTFKGFGPRKEGKLKTFLEMDKELPHTLIFYESPFRIAKLLKAAFEVYGDRQAAVCMELTKKFERCDRGFLSELIAQYEDKKVKGEAVVVIAGNNEKFINNDNEAED